MYAIGNGNPFSAIRFFFTSIRQISLHSFIRFWMISNAETPDVNKLHFYVTFTHNFNPPTLLHITSRFQWILYIRCKQWYFVIGKGRDSNAVWWSIPWLHPQLYVTDILYISQLALEFYIYWYVLHMKSFHTMFSSSLPCWFGCYVTMTSLILQKRSMSITVLFLDDNLIHKAITILRLSGKKQKAFIKKNKQILHFIISKGRRRKDTVNHRISNLVVLNYLHVLRRGDVRSRVHLTENVK
jgi:hypothetical protein